MSQVLIALICCLSALLAITVISVQVGRTTRHDNQIRYEDKWRQHAHDETMAQIEAMKPPALPALPAPESHSRIIKQVRKALR